jgi:hypothetical protein
MDTSEPSPGIPEEQSSRCPENESDFTIANISRKGFGFQGKVRKRSNSRKEDFPDGNRLPRKMSPDRVLHPPGVDSLERKQFPDRPDSPPGEIPWTDLSGVEF